MTDTEDTQLAAEIRETPEAVGRLLDREAGHVRELGARLRRLDPPVVLTAARGSSDHAAGHFAYATAILSGIPVASVGPSVVSIYRAPLRVAGAAVIAVSQSGRSPDVVAMMETARRRGAFTVAIVNDAESPLAAAADDVLAIHAGPELSVAATKSFVASTVALSSLLAAWRGDSVLQASLKRLPETLRHALGHPDAGAAARLSAAGSLFVVGRGPGLPIAREAALKFKEVARQHAEAVSAAEALHGPLALMHQRFPVVAISQGDPADAAIDESLSRFRAVGADVIRIHCGQDGAGHINLPETGHFLTNAIAAIMPAYRIVEAIARMRGHDPDQPAHITKVTETM